jgi:hypothetical protein
VIACPVWQLANMNVIHINRKWKFRFLNVFISIQVFASFVIL